MVIFPIVKSKSKLEGGADDRWYHDDVDSELDDAWREAIGRIEKHLPGHHDQQSHGRKTVNLATKIADNPKLLKLAAALAADGSADDVANVSELIEEYTDEDNSSYDKIFLMYEQAVKDKGYFVEGGYHGKVTQARKAWEQKWYGQVVGGPSKGITFAENALRAFVESLGYKKRKSEGDLSPDQAKKLAASYTRDLNQSTDQEERKWIQEQIDWLSSIKKHLPGKHDQRSHGGDNISSALENFVELANQGGREELIETWKNNPELANYLKQGALTELNKLYPGQDYVDVYHVTWGHFVEENSFSGGFDPFTSFTTSIKSANQLARDLAIEDPVVFKIRVPKKNVAVFWGSHSAFGLLGDPEYQSEILFDERIPFDNVKIIKHLPEQHDQSTHGRSKHASMTLTRGMTFYHVTISDLDKIKDEGLLRSSSAKEFSSVGGDEDYPVDGVFLANFDQARILFSQFEDIGATPKLLEVYLSKGTKVYSDPLMPESSIIVEGDIPKQNVREHVDAPVELKNTDFSQWFQEQKHLPNQHDQKRHGMRQMGPGELQTGRHVKRVLVSSEDESYTDKKGQSKTRKIYEFSYVDSETGQPITDQVLVDRLKKLAPPEAFDVMLNDDPTGEVQAVWKDAKGRGHAAYHKQHNQEAAADKFERLHQFDKRLNSARRQIKKGLSSSDPKVRDAAAILYVIDATGFRVGGEGDTKAEEQAYGAATLLNKHVSVDGTKVTFDFIGKKGVRIHKSVRDATLAEIITSRKTEAWSEQIFQHANSGSVRNYVKTIVGPEFKPHDFRTWHATNMALKWIKRRKGPARSEREFSKWQNEVGDRIAKSLGHSRSVSLSTYIDPHVWTPWRQPEWGVWVPKGLRNDDD